MYCICDLCSPPITNQHTIALANGEIAHLLPSSDLRITPDPRHTSESGSLRRDERRLGDEKRSSGARALGIILDGKIGVDVFGVRADTRERREDDTVLEQAGADFERLE